MRAPASPAHARPGRSAAFPCIDEPELRQLARLAAAVAAGDDAGTRSSLVALRGRVARGAAYEVVLQTYLFAGFPAAIDGLLALADEWPPEGGPAPEPRPAAVAEAGGWRRWRARGEELCARVYGARYERLRAWMRGLSPELDEWMIVEGYGKTLSRRGLGAAERELCAVAALAARGAVRQLEPHLEGAERLGLGRELVRAVARDALVHVAAPRRGRVEALVGRRAPAAPAAPAGEAP